MANTVFCNCKFNAPFGLSASKYGYAMDCSVFFKFLA